MEYKDSIEPQDITKLKERINNELKRRDKYGPINGFTNSNWNFAVQPKQGQEYTQDHMKKLFEPLLQIADFQMDNSIPQPACDINQINDANKFLDKVSQDTQTGNSTSCRGACTGLCFGSCGGTCQGCTGSCTGGCAGCSNSCGGNCSGCSGCGSGCTSSCKGCSGCGGCDGGATAVNK